LEELNFFLKWTSHILSQVQYTNASHLPIGQNIQSEKYLQIPKVELPPVPMNAEIQILILRTVPTCIPFVISLQVCFCIASFERKFIFHFEIGHNWPRMAGFSTQMKAKLLRQN
jgi:hypothetical protein